MAKQVAGFGCSNAPKVSEYVVFLTCTYMTMMLMQMQHDLWPLPEHLPGHHPAARGNAGPVAHPRLPGPQRLHQHRRRASGRAPGPRCSSTAPPPELRIDIQLLGAPWPDGQPEEMDAENAVPKVTRRRWWSLSFVFVSALLPAGEWLWSDARRTCTPKHQTQFCMPAL